MNYWNHHFPQSRQDFSHHDGESHDPGHSRSEPQHFSYSNNYSFGHGKRQRDSPVSSEGEWQTSFKRLKMMDDASSTADSQYSVTTNYSSIDSRFDQFKDENSTPVPLLNPSQPRSVHQLPGEQSSEPRLGYQSMNSMLGNLHSQRQKRAGGTQPAAQHPAPALESVALDRPAYQNIPHKKSISLRTTSKLY